MTYTPTPAAAAQDKLAAALAQMLTDFRDGHVVNIVTPVARAILAAQREGEERLYTDVMEQMHAELDAIEQRDDRLAAKIAENYYAQNDDLHGLDERLAALEAKWAELERIGEEELEAERTRRQQRIQAALDSLAQPVAPGEARPEGLEISPNIRHGAGTLNTQDAAPSAPSPVSAPAAPEVYGQNLTYRDVGGVALAAPPVAEPTYNPQIDTAKLLDRRERFKAWPVAEPSEGAIFAAHRLAGMAQQSLANTIDMVRAAYAHDAVIPRADVERVLNDLLADSERAPNPTANEQEGWERALYAVRRALLGGDHE